MTWNHRVLTREYKGFNEAEVLFEIHEVFYNDDGIPEMCTEDAVSVVGDNLAELKQTLRWMRKALRQPILNYADFEEGGKYYTNWRGEIEDVACAECGELIDSCECEDGFFAEEIEDE